MAQKTPTYDEITRRTVPEMDSSFRPTKEQEQQAREGFRALDDDERALYARVSSALLAAPGVDLTHVTAEVERDKVTLLGKVADGKALRVLEETIAAVPGVDTVHNKTVIG